MHECSVVSDSVTSWTIAHQAPLSVGFSRQGYWSGLPFLPPKDFPNPVIKPTTLCLLHWQGVSLPLSHLGRGYVYIYMHIPKMVDSPIYHLRCTWNIYKKISYVRSQKNFSKLYEVELLQAIFYSILTKTELVFWKFKNLPLKTFWIKRGKHIRNKKDIMK